MIDSFSTFVIQMLLITVILVSGMVSLNLSSSGQGSSDGASGSNWQALLIATALVVVALVVALLVPKTRRDAAGFWKSCERRLPTRRQRSACSATRRNCCCCSGATSSPK